MEGKSATLLVVDANQDSAYNGLALKTLDNIRVLAQSFRKNALPVIFTNYLGDDVHSVLRPYLGEPAIEKRGSSAFRETELDGVLRREGTGRLMVVGFFTQLCVFETALHGASLGYEVAVVDECCYSASRGTNDRSEAFAKMERAGIAIMDLNSAILLSQVPSKRPVSIL